MRNLGLVIMLSTAALANTAAFAKPIYMSIVCKASGTPHSQPCGGTNTRQIDLRLFIGDDNKIQGGLVHQMNYNGCYPVQATHFGKILNATVGATSVTLETQTLGQMSGGVPYLFEEPLEGTFIIDVDLDTKNLRIVQDQTWFRDHLPMAMTCEYSRGE